MLDSRWASIDAFAENNRDNILRDITRLVAVPSVEGTPEPGAPFGKGPKAALDKALEIAAELGLDTHNAEGYIGWAQTGPIADGQKYLATITHTDVVPEGNGWDADPYTVRVRDGWLLGRGVADDKGPSILCLYALKYLKDNGVTLKYPVRALLGANEETNMHDVDYFAAHFEQPAFCFTPDAEFPVCNGEKGGFGGELVSPVLENGVIVDFVGGVAHNAVPDRAACTVRLPESALKQTEGVTFEAGENGTTIIRGWGKSGHAAMPQGTVNAIGLIVTCLLESKVCSPAETAYLQVLHTLHATTDGSALGIAASDDVFDPLTIIGGTIEMKDGRLRQSEGRARVEDTVTNAKLKVSFFGPFWGDYWVLDHADDYRWSIVGEPSGRYLWLLHRDANPPAAERDALVRRAAALGYDTNLLRYTRHSR